MKAEIGSTREKISRENLAEFPPFLRFNDVLLQYGFRKQSLLAKCRVFKDCLKSIKPALKDANKICFDFKINEDDPMHFSDHSSVVIYFRDRLLPICSSFRRYEFNIDFDFDEFKPDVGADLISSILQICQVRFCSNVSIGLIGNLSLLPVDDISNWLAPKTADGVDICGKKQENRFLLIFSDIILNVQEMWDHLKEVNLIFGFKF